MLAGGCFWGIQAVYQHVKGVTNAVSGYAGGAQKDAIYDTVSSGRTGHAEAVQVTFDPKQISYGKILQIYFSVAHDPTQLNRQGPDSGPQYRSEIFPQSEAQQKVAKDYIAQLDQAHVFKRPIVTKTDSMKSAFFPAEAYHQDYAIKHPYQPYIAINDAPKVENMSKLFPDAVARSAGDSGAGRARGIDTHRMPRDRIKNGGHLGPPFTFRWIVRTGSRAFARRPSGLVVQETSEFATA